MTNIAWPRFPHVYEINTRVWLRELSRREGRRVTLDTVPIEELEKVAQLGFHAIWLMGVWTTSAAPVEVSRSNHEIVEECKRSLPDMVIEDIIGSPYAIAKYECSPELGGANGLRMIRQRMAQLGLRLMLDFVPNHFACDHELMATVPGVFVLGSEDDLRNEPQNYFRGPQNRIFARGRDPYYAGWPDTVQINYAQPAGRGQMLSELMNVASQCDGVRCDMAMLILPDIHQRVWGHRLGENPNLNSFWKEAIAAVRERFPEFLFLAESYWDLEWRLQQEGFNFTYDKTLYDRLRKNDFIGVKQHLQAEPAFRDRCCHFIENHDEPRAAGAFGLARSRSAAVASLFVPGLRLLYEGQLEGHAIKLSVHVGRRAAEKEDIETALFYEKILGVLRDNVFQTGTFAQRAVNSAGWNDNSNDAIAAYEWRPAGGRNGSYYLIVINMSGTRAYGRVAGDTETYQAGKQYVFHDQFDGKKYERDGQELRDAGLYVALEPHQPHLFSVSQK
jgi:glycosidase